MRNLWLAALSLISSPLLAWNPSTASSVTQRKAELKLALAEKEPAAQVIDKQARARQAEPDWTRKTAWKIEEGGRTYVYGVGVAPAAIHNRAMRVSTAEVRARAAIVGLTGTTTVERDGVDGGVRTTTRSEGAVSAEAVDWFEAGDGSLYALVVEVR